MTSARNPGSWPFLARVAFQPTRRERWLACVALLLVLVNLFYQGAQPYAVGLFQPPWDKLAHLVVYSGFAVLSWVLLGGRHPGRVIAINALIGFCDEFAQAFEPGRSLDAGDWAVDVLAAVIVVVVLTLVRRHWVSYRAGL